MKKSFWLKRPLAGGGKCGRVETPQVMTAMQRKGQRRGYLGLGGQHDLARVVKKKSSNLIKKDNYKASR